MLVLCPLDTEHFSDSEFIPGDLCVTSVIILRARRMHLCASVCPGLVARLRHILNILTDIAVELSEHIANKLL